MYSSLIPTTYVDILYQVYIQLYVTTTTNWLFEPQSSGGSRGGSMGSMEPALLRAALLYVYFVSLRKRNYVHHSPHWRYTDGALKLHSRVTYSCQLN